MAAPRKNLAIVGGGAAGFFTAANLSDVPSLSVDLFESSRTCLAKVAVSGGGRCNVTQNCFTVCELINGYPRGSKELRGPFSRFQPLNTVEWFRDRGVNIVAEADGRMFPESNSSATIVECLTNACSSPETTLHRNIGVREVSLRNGQFSLSLSNGAIHEADYLLLATGSNRTGHALASSLGHTITELAPSLFTFKCVDKRIENLAGIAFEHCHLRLSPDPETKGLGQQFEQSGPLLITHWGLSGPAVLRLSAFAARELQRTSYSGSLTINWTAQSIQSCREHLAQLRVRERRKTVMSHPQFSIPRRFWERLVGWSTITDQQTYGALSNTNIDVLSLAICASELKVSGKGAFKEEFVTCGGVERTEIDFKRFESKVVPNLFFAGEILDIDGVTGGYNFQAAWTGGWTVAKAIKDRLGKAEVTGEKSC